MPRHPVIAALNIASIALGVAVFLAIQIANHSAFRTFQAGVDMVAGKSHLEVRAADGRLDETIYPTVLAAEGVRTATPICEGFVTLPDRPGEYLRILGIEPLSGAGFQTAAFVATSVSKSTGSPDGTILLTQPYTLSLPRSLAANLGVAPGDRIRVAQDAGITELPVGFIGEDPAAGSDSRSAAMDIGWCQELFATQGYLSSIQILLDDPDDSAQVAAQLNAMLPPGVKAAPPAGRSQQIGTMLRGFQLNITALSMVSILVGIFLIYNTTSAAVVRRRKEIATLRALGASREHVTWLFLRHALVHGTAGVLLGIGLGIGLARALLGAVSETISTHYVLMSIDRAYLSPWAIAVAAAYGFAAVITGAYLPAREAATTDPASALRAGGAASSRPRGTTKLATILGTALIAAAALTAYASLNGAPAPLSFFACFLLIVGSALVVPAVSDLCAKAIAKMADAVGALLPGLSARAFRRSLHRTAVTTGALMVAVAMMVGVSVMIASFRGTVDRWVTMAMAADIFVAPAANEIIGFHSHTPPEVRDYLAALPGVRQVDTHLETPVELANGNTYALAAVEGGTNDNFSFVGGSDRGIVADMLEPDRVIISEPLAAKLDKHAGDPIAIPTPAGPRDFTIAGVYYDYSDDNGRIIISRANFDRHWDNPNYHSLAVYLHDGTAATPIIADLRARFSGGGELAIYTNRSIRERIFDIFDQTFAVTYILRSIAIIVAALGIALTLATLVTERSREIGVMRAVGAGRRQIYGTYLGEACLIGALGTFTGIACGIGLAMLLTWVVNRAFFGWTIQFSIPWGELAVTPLWTIPVALIAGLLPAARAARLGISRAVRME